MISYLHPDKTCHKANRYIFKGSNPAIFSFPSLPIEGHLFKEQILSLVDTVCKGFGISGAKKEVSKVVPFSKKGRKTRRSAHST